MTIRFNKFRISVIHTGFYSEYGRNKFYAELTLKNILNGKYIRFNIRRKSYIDEQETLRAWTDFIKEGCTYDICFERFCEVQNLDVQDKKSKTKWQRAEHKAKLLRYLNVDNIFLLRELEDLLDESVKNALEAA